MTFVFKVAKRGVVYPKVILSGVSGSGKTLSSLMLACGMVGGEWDQIVLVDADNNASTHYVDTMFTVGDGQTEPVETVTIGSFVHVDFQPPYHPDRWKQVIQQAIETKCKVLILDNFSAEWEGEGGMLDWSRNLGYNMGAWGVTSPVHRQLVQTIRQVPIPVIITAREEQKIESIKVPDNKGGERIEIKKLGLKVKQKEDFEYEFDLHVSLDHNHMARVSKDRTGLFSSRLPAPITPETGRTLANWALSGSDPVGSRGWVARKVDEINKADSIESLKTIYLRTMQQGASLLTQEAKQTIIAAKDAAKRRLEVGSC